MARSACLVASIALLVGCAQPVSQQPAQSSSADNPHAVRPNRLQVFLKGTADDAASRRETPNAEEMMVPADLALADENTKVRLQAVSTLVDDGSDQAAATLAVVASSDVDSAVREEAIYALGEIGAESGIEVIKQALMDPHRDVRRAAIEAFAEIGGEESALALSVALNDRDVSVRAEAVDALGEIGGDTAVRLLRRAAEDQESSIREAAAEYLAELSQ